MFGLKEGITKRVGRVKGFTLIEIVVVLVILGTLLGAGFLFVPGQLMKARDGRRKSDLQMISRVLEGVYDVDGSFPGELPECGTTLKTGDTEWMEIPCDPKSKQDYYYESETVDGGSWFRMYTNLERLDDQSIIWTRCQGGCGPDCAYNYGVSSSSINLDTCLPPILQYACSPGGGAEGICEAYDDPELSQCPKVYVDDPTCREECGDPSSRCKNASGKSTPDN